MPAVFSWKACGRKSLWQNQLNAGIHYKTNKTKKFIKDSSGAVFGTRFVTHLERLPGILWASIKIKFSTSSVNTLKEYRSQK
jgi:hypothetical protein